MPRSGIAATDGPGPDPDPGTGAGFCQSTIYGEGGWFSVLDNIIIGKEHAHIVENYELGLLRGLNNIPQNDKLHHDHMIRYDTHGGPLKPLRGDCSDPFWEI